MESCSACPAGHYCSTEGLANPSGPCAAGFYCPFDFSSTTPYAFLCPKVRNIPKCLHSFSLCSLLDSELSSLLNIFNIVFLFFKLQLCCLLSTSCSLAHHNLDAPLSLKFFSQGHYCPEGSPLAVPCPTGEYQPNPGSQSCIPCRPGFYCEEAIEGEPRPCPPHSFCPAGILNGWRI